MNTQIEPCLGEEAEALLAFKCMISKGLLHLPGPDFVERVLISSERKAAVLRNLQPMFDHERLAETGYLLILPVEHDVEHGAPVQTEED